MMKHAITLVLFFLLTGCAFGQPCSMQSAEYLAKLEELLVRWDDANSVAGSSSRLSLGSSIPPLQQIRREVNTLTPPECAKNIQALSVAYMDTTINLYLSFMAQKPDEEVNAQAQESKQALEQFIEERRKLQAGEEPYN